MYVPHFAITTYYTTSKKITSTYFYLYILEHLLTFFSAKTELTNVHDFIHKMLTVKISFEGGVILTLS